MVIIGLLAIVSPQFTVITTLGVTLFIGWLFLIGGVIQVFSSFQEKGAPFWGLLLLGILGTLVGIFLVFNPLQGIASLTMLLSILIFLNGIFHIALAFQFKGAPFWIALIGGILGILLAFIIWNNWPFSAVWVIGIIFGVNMLFSGISQIVIASEKK